MLEIPAVRKQISFSGSLLLALVGLLVPGCILLFFGISAWEYLKFLTALGILVWIPGRSLLWLSGLRIPPLVSVVLAVVLGMTGTTVVNKFSRWFHVEVVFFLWIGAALVYFVFHLVKFPPKKKDLSIRVTTAGIVLFMIILTIIFSLLIDNYSNGVSQLDGSREFKMHYYDGFYRNAVARELSHTVPPQVPMFGDLPLGYHYGMDLFVSLFYRYFGLDIFDLNHRLVITFFFISLVLSLYVLIRELFFSSRAALIGVFLILFGSGGLSYLASWILGISQWGNLFFSFYFFNLTNINSILPGLSIFAAGFICLIAYLRERRIPWLIFSSLLLAFAFEFKQFFIGPTIGALILAGLLLWIFRRDFGLLRIAFLTTAVSAPLLLAAFSHNSGSLAYKFRFHFVDWIIFPLKDMDLTYLYLTWKGVIQHGSITPLNLMLVFACVVIFFTGAYGFSILALPVMVKEFFSFRRIRPERFFLATFFGGCVIYSFFMQLSFAGRPRSYVNIYTFFLSAVVLTIFFAEKLAGFLGKKRAWVKILLLCFVLAGSIPNTIRFLYFKVSSPQPRNFSAAFLRTADWINANTETDSMILHPLQLRYVCYFADRRVLLDNSSHSYITYHLSPRQIESRTAEIEGFFLDPAFHGEVLENYGVDYIWTDRSGGFLTTEGHPHPSFDCYSDLGTESIRKYQKCHVLELAFKNAEFLIYQVRKIPQAQREVYLLEEEEGSKKLKPWVVHK